MEAGQLSVFNFEYLVTKSQFSIYLVQHDKNILEESYIHACQFLFINLY